MGSNYRQNLIRLVTFLGGMYFFLEFVLPKEIGGVKFGAFHEQISIGFAAIGAMAIGLGLINLFLVHGSKVVFKRKRWGNSAALLGGLILMIVVTAGDWLATLEISNEVQRVNNLRRFISVIESDYKGDKEGVPDLATRNSALLDGTEELLLSFEPGLAELANVDPEARPPQADQLREQFLEHTSKVALTMVSLRGAEAEADFEIHHELASHLALLGNQWRELRTAYYEQSLSRQLYNLLYRGLFVSLGASMFSLLGFYIAVAAYRAFRIQTVESGLMMAAAVVVMLGQIPFGLWLWDGFPELRLWLLSVPSAAASRAIKIGAAVAGLVIAFRMWLSIESESFSQRDS